MWLHHYGLLLNGLLGNRWQDYLLLVLSADWHDSISIVGGILSVHLSDIIRQKSRVTLVNSCLHLQRLLHGHSRRRHLNLGLSLWLGCLLDRNALVNGWSV